MTKPKAGRRNGRRAKSPAFQFYPADFLADPKVQCMTTEEVGAYLLLLCAEWLDGPLPADHAFLARICRLDRRRFARAWVAVGRCFQPSELFADRIENPRMEREREFQVENRQRLRDNADKTNEKLGRATQKETQSDTLSDTQSDTLCDRSGIAPNTQRPTPESQIPTPGVCDNRTDARSERVVPDRPNIRAAHLAMHPTLDTPEVRAALDRWEGHLRARNRPLYTAHNWEANLVDWERWGPDALVEAIAETLKTTACTVFRPTVRTNGSAADTPTPRHLVPKSSGLLEMPRTKRGGS